MGLLSWYRDWKKRREEQRRARVVSFLRFFTEGHASFCQCSGCSVLKKFEAGKL